MERETRASPQLGHLRLPSYTAVSSSIFIRVFTGGLPCNTLGEYSVICFIVLTCGHRIAALCNHCAFQKTQSPKTKNIQKNKRQKTSRSAVSEFTLESHNHLPTTSAAPMHTLSRAVVALPHRGSDEAEHFRTRSFNIVFLSSSPTTLVSLDRQHHLLPSWQKYLPSLPVA